MTKSLQNKKGFTLIEILVVVALIAILATITFIAINPAKNFRDTRNAQRSSAVNEILNAVTQYTSEQGNSVGDFGAIEACDDGTDNIGSGAGNINLSTLLVDEFIVEIPADPSGGSDEDTGYDICLTAGNRVQISAPSAEGGATISVQR